MCGAHHQPRFSGGGHHLPMNEENAFNARYGHQFLPTLATVVPVASAYAVNLYARALPELLFAMDKGNTSIIDLSRGVLHSCKLAGCASFAGGYLLLKRFRMNPPVEGAITFVFIEDVMNALAPADSHDAPVIAAVTIWIQKDQDPHGVGQQQQVVGTATEGCQRRSRNRPSQAAPDLG